MLNKIIYFDLETTGTNFWQHGIHQLSGIIEIDGVVKEEFNFKVAPNPLAKVEQGALDVCSVTLEQIQSYPKMGEVYKQFWQMLEKYCDKFNKLDKFFLIGFNNASFDNQFLRAWFTQNGDNYFGSWFWSNPIDVYVLSSHLLMNERHTMTDFKLKTVCQKMGIEVDETKLHDAVYDVYLTRDLYLKTINYAK